MSIDLNLTILCGECPAPPVVRTLDSGRRLATLDLRVKGGRVAGEQGTTSVPVTVWEPDAWLEAVEPGAELAVLGRVRRRFFRIASGGVGTRVDVEAERVVPQKQRRRLAALIRRAEDALASTA
jgi:hypothetical protein